MEPENALERSRAVAGITLFQISPSIHSRDSPVCKADYGEGLLHQSFQSVSADPPMEGCDFDVELHASLAAERSIAQPPRIWR
jgi:hypothetical protein